MNANRRTVLIVDDDNMLVNMYRAKFCHENYDVLTAYNGEQGLDLIKDRKPEFVVMDVMMPKMDGLEVLRHIRETPDIKDTPVLMISNEGKAEFVNEAKKYGAKDYMVKADYNPEDIVKKVSSYLN